MNISTAADGSNPVRSADATAKDLLRFESATTGTNPRTPIASQLIEATETDEFVAHEIKRPSADTLPPNPRDPSKLEESA